MKLTSACLLALCMLLFPSNAHAQTSQLTEADSLTVEAAAAIARAAPWVAHVWPGFWPEDRAFLVMRPMETALLVSPRTPPPAYKKLDDDAVPAPLRGLAYLRDAYPPGFGPHVFKLSYPVGTDTVAALEPRGRTLPSRLGFYYHETFHGWQNARWAQTDADTLKARMGQALGDTTYSNTAVFGALGEVERLALAEALATEEMDALTDLLRGYLAVRALRSDDSWRIRLVEHRMERREGTAVYAGCHAAARAVGAVEGAATACVQRYLARDLTEYSNFPEADAQLLRWRQYGTGGALSLLLDRLRPGWKREVKRGAYLGDLLVEAVGYDQRRDGSRVPALLDRFGYVDLLAGATE